MTKRNYIAIFFIFSIVIWISCKKNETPHLSVLPLIEGAELHFRGFVTNDQQELVSQIHTFSRKVVRRDTIDQRPVFVYMTNNQPTYFYTDKKNGTVWQHNTDDIGLRIVMYGFAYQPLNISYWQILLKIDKGVGTEWSFSVDTTFTAITSEGKSQRIRYLNNGKARYEGLKEAFIPESNKYVPAHDAYWYELDTFILNETTSDTLFASSGTAHQYFDPKLGSIKYITDFTKSEIGQPTIPLHGTWELVSKNIPE